MKKELEKLYAAPNCKCLGTRKVTTTDSSPRYEIVTTPDGIKTAIMKGFNCDVCGLPRNGAVEIDTTQ